MSATRTIALFALWLVLEPSAAPADVAAGVCSALFAMWVSVRLSPRGTMMVSALPSLFYVPHFLLCSVRGGFDVARRALAPDMRLHTGYVDYQTGMPRGFARNTFATITSLMPGTVPCGDLETTLVFHCLDATQPVAAQLAVEECALKAALGGKLDD